tara:strand:+ start:269 stop:430 length:162 start_codon:yes stop_codon:yes gene_type:complete
MTDLEVALLRNNHHAQHQLMAVFHLEQPLTAQVSYDRGKKQKQQGAKMALDKE